MNSSQKKVLEILRRNPAVTAGEVARALGKTPANGRYHLARLVEDGLVEPAGERRSAGRGAPEHLYRLSGMAMGNNLGMLAAALLEEAQAIPGRDGQAGRMARLAHHLAGDWSPDRTMHVTRQLAAAVEWLNQLHYQSRWEATASGPRLVLSNCPYREIIDRHPELCGMDVQLVSLLLGASVEQTARLERSARGGIFCAFLAAGGSQR